MAALIAPLSAQAQPPDPARAFVQSLYDAYGHGEPVDVDAKAPTTFAPHLLALIRHDQATTPLGYAPDLDWDPICACQDDSGLKVKRIEMTDAKPGRKVATVTLSYGDGADGRVIVRLDLVLVHRRWRVADIHTKDAPSLVSFLEESARREAAEAKRR
jgi:hypothetical protein